MTAALRIQEQRIREYIATAKATGNLAQQRYWELQLQNFMVNVVQGGGAPVVIGAPDESGTSGTSVVVHGQNIEPVKKQPIEPVKKQPIKPGLIAGLALAAIAVIFIIFKSLKS